MSDNEITVDPSDAESIAFSIIDVDLENRKAVYLSYRASGFTNRESCQIMQIHPKTVTRWSSPNYPNEFDPAFLEALNRLPELRKTLGLQFANYEFLRNFRLFLFKDYQVIKKSIVEPAKMTEDDNKYLMKIRAQYTPQQMESIKLLSEGKSTNVEEGTFDFKGFCLSLSRVKTEEKIQLEVKGRDDNS